MLLLCCKTIVGVINFMLHVFVPVWLSCTAHAHCVLPYWPAYRLAFRISNNINVLAQGLTITSAEVHFCTTPQEHCIVVDRTEGVHVHVCEWVHDCDKIFLQLCVFS